MTGSPAHSLKSLLTAAELAMPDRVREPYGTILNWGKTLASLALSLRLPIYRLEGKEQLVGYVGRGTNLNLITSLVYDKVPELHPVDSVLFPNLTSTVQHLRTEYDLVIVELPYRVLRPLPRQTGFLSLPWVRWQINTERCWKEVENGFNKDATKDLKKMGPIEFVQTHKQTDFEHFYQKIYHPYVTKQYGALAEPSSFASLQHYFDHGWLALYVEDGEILGGGIQYTRSNILYNYVMGLSQDITRKQRTRVSTARQYYSLKLALELGCQALDVGLTRPFLNDGVARYKRKWGSNVLPDLNQNWGLWVSVGRDPTKAAYFLAQHPWIWLDHDEQLRGLIVVDDSDELSDSTMVEKQASKLWVSGLHTITVYATSGFDTEESPIIDGPLPELDLAMEWQPITNS